MGLNPASPEATPRQVGFVIIGIVHSLLFVVRCYNITYVNLSVLDIGFVLHKTLIISYVIFRRLYLILVKRFSWYIVHGL